MTWTALDTWIVVAGALCAMSCALLGNYLVLRRISMMGDAISHTVLPGLAMAFVLTGSRDSLTMFAGACTIGVLTALLVEWLLRAGRLEEGAAMGVVFTSLFAIGLILIRQAARHVDLDPGCVLYGAIELSPLDTTPLFGWNVPHAVVTGGAMLLLNGVFVVLFYKELLITSFDPALATTLGIHAGLLHYVLMTLVAATVVAAFENVGSILVIAMLIVPGACAHLLTDRLPMLHLISLAIAGLSAVLGHWVAICLPVWFGLPDTSTAGMMAAVAGLFFVAVFLFAPRYGVISRWLHQALLALRIACDDLVGYLYRQQELVSAGAEPATARTLREALHLGWKADLVRLWLIRRRWLVRTDGGYRLTPLGRARAQDIIRAHRLWETYLVRVSGSPADDVHDQAHHIEHVTDGRLEQMLESATGHPARDPHERDIPRKRRVNGSN